MSCNTSSFVKFTGGYTAMESPEWTPARSTCSIIPGISMEVPSDTASTSTSMPLKYLSIRIG